MADVAIGNYAGNRESNAMRVMIGDLELFFSYQTVVAFYTPKTGLVLSENLWGNTTGKHLNAIGDKSKRINRDDFERQLAKVRVTVEA